MEGALDLTQVEAIFVGLRAMGFAEKAERGNAILGAERYDPEKASGVRYGWPCRGKCEP